MRFSSTPVMAWIVVMAAATIGRGQSESGPALLPSMVTAEQFIAEEISDPWFPPTNVAAAPLATTSPVGTTSDTTATAPPADSAPEPAPSDFGASTGELPAPKNASSTPSVDENLEAAIPDDSLVPDDTPWYMPQAWFSPLPWNSGIELGLNGSAGNNEAMSVRTGGYIKRESRFSKLDMNSYYNKTTTRDETTQNNATLDIRNDWMLDDTSPWTLYGTGNAFYDEFQAFDLQVAANTGVGYRFVNRPELSMIGRFGGGTSREFGGPDDRWVPESLFGFEYNQQFAGNQKLYGKIDYYPEWEEVGEFRMVTDVGWEVELNQPKNLSLKISATDRYDSTPHEADPNLVNYSVLLLLKL